MPYCTNLNIKSSLDNENLIKNESVPDIIVDNQIINLNYIINDENNNHNNKINVEINFLLNNAKIDKKYEIASLKLPDGEELSKLIINNYLNKSNIDEKEKIKLSLKYQIFSKNTSLFAEIELSDKITEEMKKEIMGKNESSHPMMNKQNWNQIINDDLFSRSIMTTPMMGMSNPMMSMSNPMMSMSNPMMSMSNQMMSMSNPMMGMNNQMMGMSNQMMGMNNQMMGMSNQMMGMNNQMMGMINPMMGMSNQMMGMNNQMMDMSNPMMNNMNQMMDMSNPMMNNMNQMSMMNQMNMKMKSKELNLEKSNMNSEVDEFKKIDLNKKDDIMKIINSQDFINGFWEINEITKIIKEKFIKEYDLLKGIRNNKIIINEKVAITILIIYFINKEHPELLDELLMIIEKAKIFISNEAKESYENIIKEIGIN